MSKLSAKIKEEIHSLLPTTIFFIALHIVELVRVLMLEGGQGSGTPRRHQ